MIGGSLGQFLFEPEPVNKDNVLWLLSPLDKASDEVKKSLAGLSGQLLDRLIVIRASSNTDDGSQPFPSLQWTEQLRAIVIVLKEDSLKDEHFRRCVNWCIRYIDEHYGIPLFVCSTGLNRQEIVDLGDKLRKQGDSLLQRLLERVQLPDPPTPEHLAHLLRVDLGSHPSEQSLKTQAATLLGQLASLILLCCGTATGIAACAMLMLGQGSFIAYWIIANSIATAITAGITIAFLLSICVVLLRSMTVGSLLQALSRNRGRLILSSFAGPATFLLFLQIHVLPSDVALGIVIGILLDITRHNGHLARRARLSLDTFLSYRKAGEQQYLEEIEQIQALFEKRLFEYPFFPIIASPALSDPANRQTRNRNPFLYHFGTPLQIFISYARRRGGWSRFYARNLYRILVGKDMSAFIDIRGLREGSTGWRNSLSRALTETNVFIAVLDEKSVTSSWVAAEMRAALEGKAISGKPEIVVLLSPQLSAKVPEGICPVFKAVLQYRAIAEKKGWIHYIEASDSTACDIYDQIERLTGKDKISQEDEQYLSKRVTEHLSEQVLPDLQSHLGAGPSILGRPLTAYLLSYQLASRLIALISPILGFGALIVAILHGNDFLSFSSSISRDVLNIVYLICCYSLGYLARHSFAFDKVRFQIPSVGFAVIISLFVWHIAVPISALDWGIALCWIGWLVSGPAIQGEIAIEQVDPGWVKVEKSKWLWQKIPDLTPGRWGGKINPNASHYRTNLRILEAKEMLQAVIKKHADTSSVNEVMVAANKALAMEELGLLYRATNEFEKARTTYEESLNLLKVLRKRISAERQALDELTEWQVLDAYRETVFRLAELDHAQGNHASAKTGYEETLQIDELLAHDKREEEEYTRHLLQEVNGEP